MHFLSILILLTFVSSCGKSGSSAGVPIVKEKVIPLNGSNIDGLYMAQFMTLNPGVNGSLPGSATLQRQNDKFFAYVRLFGGAPNAWHQQVIYEGKRCPMASDDVNGDGYIDAIEGRNVWGQALIPLDSNIGSQVAGKNIYPVADATGTYFYERVTSFDDMFSDLKKEDKNLTDNLTKLGPDKGLDFEGRVVVIHGSSDTVVYPPTVATTDEYAQHQTLPIACGIFSKITRVPGDIETGEIPGPVEGPTTDVPPTPPVEPVPTPVPDTHGDGDEDSDRRDRDDDWVGRVRDWWRSRWERSRGNRPPTDWGDGWTFRL
jgi:hypothetical protein